MLRLPEGMRDQIKAAAEASKRTMNAEIVARLETSLAADDRSALAAKRVMAMRLTDSPDPLHDLVMDLSRRVERLEKQGR